MDSRQLWRSALDHAGAGQMEAAARDFEACARLEPGNPDAWNNLGSALQLLRRFQEAEAAHRKALLLAPEHPEFRSNLGHALFQLERLGEAEAELRRAGPHPDALFNLALVLRRAEKYEEAMAAYDALLAADPGHARGRSLRAMALLEEGRFREGWEAYECRWQLPEFQALRRNRPPLWDGRPGPLLLHGEQGFGDAIQMLRFVPELARRAEGLCLDLDAPLLPLIGDQGWRVKLPPFRPVPGASLPVMSLPRVMDLQPAQLPGPIPYLRADPGKREAWRERLGPRRGRRVGLVWSGNPAYESDAERSVPLAAFAPLRLVPDLQWISLQMGPGRDELPGLGTEAPMLDAAPHLLDFSDTAALLSCLDLVLAVDTAVPHLAGALGVPTWLLLPRPCDWRWGREGQESRWYPGHRLFRQPRRGDWEGCLAAVGQELARDFGPPQPS
ncbi:MAG: glycosyltransferase family protein [Acidobacteria bacterium]|nr:glycosyltransferase family protein [Acidobacteriota bacterium]